MAYIQFNSDKFLRTFAIFKKLFSHGELFPGMLTIILVIGSFLYIMHITYLSEKRFLKEELTKRISLCVRYWNELESAKPDGNIRAYSFNGREHEVNIYLNEKSYTFKIDSTSDFMDIHTRIACDMNLSAPLSLSRLDSLMRTGLNNKTRGLSIALKRIDSLGNTVEMYPKTHTMEMEEAGYVRLGYISGEKIGALIDYSWLDYFKIYWWKVLGLTAVAAIIIQMIIVIVKQVRKYSRMKYMQEKAFRQRLHDLKNPASTVEIILLNAYLKAPEAFYDENGICNYQIGMDNLAMLKGAMTSILEMYAMLYSRRVEWEKINLREELEKLILEFQLSYKEKKEVRAKMNYALPESLILSRQFLYVLHNLIDNAVKYSDKVANITISCYNVGKQIMISVEDQGKGIAEKDLPYIFEEFRRVDMEKETQGYGLGLAFVKKIVKRHKGEIKVESKLGIGSKFIIKIHEYGRKN